jgi:hypothetical protein
MEHDDFIVLPGDCFRCEDTTEGIRVAQVIRPLNDDTLAVFFGRRILNSVITFRLFYVEAASRVLLISHEPYRH